MKTNLLLSWIVMVAVGAACAGQAASDWAITEVLVAPPSPNSPDEVSIIICGTAPTGAYQVDYVNTRIEGNDIYIDMYWHLALTPQAASAVAPARYESTVAFGQAPFRYTVALGTLSPGMYTVHVALCSTLYCDGGGRATMTFCRATTTVSVSDAPTPPDPEPQTAEPEPEPADPIKQMRQSIRDRLASLGNSFLELPGFEIRHVDWSDKTSIKEGISRLSISPTEPKPSDEVSVTVSGWKSSAELAVENTTLRIEGTEIWLDVYWHARPLVSLDRTQGACANGLLFAQESRPPVTVTQYDITPYEGVPYEYTKSLGTLDAGTYTLHVTNHGPVSGSASMTFTVGQPTDQDEQQHPWWWSALYGTP